MRNIFWDDERNADEGNKQQRMSIRAVARMFARRVNDALSLSGKIDDATTIACTA